MTCNRTTEERYNTCGHNPFTDPLNPQNSEKYIVQGSNTIEPFKNIEIETTSDIPSTETLENAAQDTTEDNTPFTNFPEGGSNLLKDPVLVWDREYN